MNQAIVWLTTLLRERRRWNRSGPDDPRNIRIFYGYKRLPSPGDIASGGIVKTQDLQTAFPNRPTDPNLLYLISSALPPYAPLMSRLARRAGAKIVLNQNGVAYPAWHGPGWQKTNRFMREVLQQADFVFYQSAFCKLGADQFLDERRDYYEVLYNPVDTSFFRPAPTSLPRSPLRLLLAGSHTHIYRVQVAVDTLRSLRDAGIDALMEIAGRFSWRPSADDARRECTSYIKRQELTESVTFTGPYTQAEAPYMFQRSHILLHTKYNDPCPRLVVEAMACGLPVVYSTSGGTPELVGEHAGIGVPAPLDWEQDHPPDPARLAKAALEIMARYDEFSAAARKRAVSKFDTTPWIERHRSVFNQLLSGSYLAGIVKSE